MPAAALNSARDVHRERGSGLTARGLGLLCLMLGAMEISGARQIAAEHYAGHRSRTRNMALALAAVAGRGRFGAREEAQPAEAM